MKTKRSASSTRILRHEDSLRSRQYGGICVRVLYECDGLEILRIDMEPKAVLDDDDMMRVHGLHFIIGGNPVFRVGSQNSDLMPGDSITFGDGEHCTVSNPTSSRSSILSFLFKTSSPCHSAGAYGHDTAKSPDRDKEISR